MGLREDGVEWMELDDGDSKLIYALFMFFPFPLG